MNIKVVIPLSAMKQPNTKVFTILSTFIIILPVFGPGCAHNYTTTADDDRPFYKDRVVTAQIIMTDADWEYTCRNAMLERVTTYIYCFNSKSLNASSSIYSRCSSFAFHSSGIASTPRYAPQSAPVIAPIVSVSPPRLTAYNTASLYE